jgi:succinate dehydrogenase / fumarate reductase cytochrome b subunit
MSQQVLPRSYINKRFHSLAGLWLVVFLIEHLITNSQAALYIGDWGQGFVKMVNDIHDLPYLQVFEILFLGLPLLVHGILGVKYLFTAKFNSISTSGQNPHLGKYARNHTFTWQRLTSWILLLCIVLHVIQMRFLNYPMKVNGGINQEFYMVRLNMDPGLYGLAPRLQAVLYNSDQIEHERERFIASRQVADANFVYIPEIGREIDEQVMLSIVMDYLITLSKKALKPTEVIAVSRSFGSATLLSVRDTFKSPLMISLYTIFVIAACFHAFNGLWTAMISWGITLTSRSQQVMRWIAVSFTVSIALLGLAAVWLTYFVNLR